jgi:ribonucleoside-triphosphate reductase
MLQYAEHIDINPAAAGTCIKPAGNSTELVNVHSSGMHAAHDKRYWRRMRLNKSDPVAKLLYMQGALCEDEINHPDTTWVYSWPREAPDTAILKDELSALDQLKMWMIYSEHWCEHNPSMTVTVKEEEWLEVGAFVYKNFDKMLGVTFLPHSGHTYLQAPYESMTDEEYEKAVDQIPAHVDWSLLSVYETEDQTESAKELACVSGSCAI